MPKALSDKRLFELAEKRYHAHQAFKEAEAEKKKIDAEVIPELDRRKTRAISGLGWSVTKTVQTYKKYHADVAKRTLKPKVYAAITTEAIDPDKLAQAVSDGLVKPKQLAKIVEVVQKSAYLNVSPDAASAPE